MPTGHCNYPHHHTGPSAGLPWGFIGALAIAALIIAYIHVVILILVIVAALGVVVVAGVMLVHSHHAVPYDAAYELPAPEAQAPAPPLRAAAERIAPAPSPSPVIFHSQPPAIVHQHLHLHGVSAADVAEVLARQASPDYPAVSPRYQAIEERS